MTKKTKAIEETAAPEASAPVEAAMGEVITGTLVLYSVEVDEDAKPLEERVLTISKGKTETGKVRYQASQDGVSGKIAASITAAINDLLETGFKVLPAAWGVPKNEQGVNFPEKGDNKPKEPTTIDDLSSDMADAMLGQMAELTASFAEYRNAESRTREIIRAVAVEVRDLRLLYTKAEFGIFTRLAPEGSDVGKLLTAKNTLGEFVFFANIPDALLELMPEGKASPKAAQAWINGLRSMAAHTVVDIVRANPELSAGSLTRAVRVVIKDHLDGREPIAWDTDAEAVDYLLALHTSGWPDGRLLDANADGQLSPTRGEDGKHVTSSVFGSEGADELIKALANAFNSYKSPSEQAAIADMKARTKAVVTADFNLLSPDQVALHLFNILAGRVNDTTEETLATTVGECLIVVDKIGGWFDAISDGTMTVADVLSPATPTSEADAEGEGDATA